MTEFDEKIKAGKRRSHLRPFSSMWFHLRARLQYASNVCAVRFLHLFSLLRSVLFFCSYMAIYPFMYIKSYVQFMCTWERLFRCVDNLALFRTHADIKTHAPLFSLLLPIYINIISCVWTFMPIQNHFYLVVLCLFWRNIEESTKCFANTHNSVVYFASGDACSV